MKKFYLLFICLTFCISIVKSQSSQVTGKVTSEDDGQPLPGVNVLIEGTTQGTVTDVDGNYRINVDRTSVTLVFSFIGFASQQVPLNGRNVVDVSLAADLQQLSEVIITGYGERDKSSFTGSAASIGSSDIEDKPFANVEEALQGNIAGLQLSASSGTPGSIQDIRIRGISSITAGNSPLYVIDGIPVINGSNQGESIYGALSVMTSLSSTDIESITVLKDASATALYGARGANGVIVITTKKGKEGKPTVSISSKVGSVARAVAGPDMLNAAQYDELYYESRVNAGQATTIDEAKTLYPNGWDGKSDTDWKDVVTNDDAMFQSYDLSVRGGNEKSSFYASLGYFQQDGVSIAVGMEKTTGKLSYETKLGDKWKLNTNTTGSFVDHKGQMEGASWFGNPDAAIVHLHPIDPVRNNDGSLNLNLSNPYYNPIYQAENTIHSKKQTRILNSTDLEYKILDNLTFTSTIGMDFLYTEELNYDPREYGDGAFVNGYSFGYSNRNFNYDWKNRLDYSLRFSKDSQLDLKLVYEAQKNKHHGLAAGGSDIAADGLFYPSSVANPTYISGYVDDWAINSILLMGTYTWHGNVILDATLRREGSSRFAQDNRWGTFYSIGAAWVFSEEGFMAGSADWLNTSKIRVSYGKIGNASIGLNEYQSFLGYNGTYNNQAGSYPSQLGNQNLGWENNQSFNAALDFGLFERLEGSVEYFNRKTYDLLLDVPLSPTSGFSSQRQNVGDMVNKGWELTLSGDIVRGQDFAWNLGVNLTSISNEVTKLPQTTDGDEIGIETLRSIVTVGEAVYAWYLPTWAGVDPANGLPLWYVEGKSGETTSVYSEAEKSIQGSTFPTFYGGVNTRLSYKGISLSANLYYSTGNKVYDAFAYYARSDGRFNFGISNGYASLMDRWQKPGDVAQNPRNVYQNTFLSTGQSTRNLHDGEYLRLRDVTLGYDLPISLISKIGFNSANLYLKGTNMWTWVKDENLEYDPEVGAGAVILLNGAPIKTYVVGLNISF